MKIAFRILDGDRPTIDKDPDASKVYGVDMTKQLAGKTLATVAGEAVGVNAEPALIQGNLLLARVTGGTVGEEASLRFRYTTTDGDIDDHTIYFNIKEQ